MGVAVMLLSTGVDHNSFPVLESKARKRRSPVAPIKITPPAVTIGPPLPADPTFFLPSGMLSLMPRGTFHARSPVVAFTATRLAQGGLKHGRLPRLRPFSSSAGALKLAPPVRT